MKKRFSVIFILLSFVLAISILTSSQLIKPKTTIAFADKGETVEISSKSAYLIDAQSKTEIFSKNSIERLPIASMCKIMTLLLCFENINAKNINFDDVVKISEQASGMGGSQVFLESDGEYSVGELIKSIVVASANDACVAMAEYLYGSESEFVVKMNEKAIDLGMENTNFVNCTGLPQSGQFSCAKDVATMFAELIKHEEYFRFSRIWTDIVKHPNDRITEISNTNKLIRFYKGCDSGKTGYTSEAGHCLCASALRGNMRLISVVISAPDSKTRFGESSSMFNYGFSNYENKILVEENVPLNIPVTVLGGKKDFIETVPENSFYLFSRKNETRSVEIDFLPKEIIKAPLYKGEILGTINIYENNIQIASINVLANEDILSKTYFDIVKDVTNSWPII